MGGYLWRSVKNDQNLLAQTYYKNLTSCDPSSDPKEQVQLSIKMSNINIGSSYVVTIGIIDDLGNFRTLGITNQVIAESSKKDLLFDTTFIIDYYFEKHQVIVFKITKNYQNFTIKTMLANVMGSRCQTFIKEISEGDDFNRDKIIVIGDTLKNNNTQIIMMLSVESQLNRIDSIFIIIKRQRMTRNVICKNNISTDSNEREEKEYVIIYKSEVQNLRNSISNFHSIKIPSNILCNGEYSNLILIDIYDFNSMTVIATLETSVQCSLNIKKIYDLKGSDALKVHVKSEIITEYTFLDYLKGGIQIALTIGIDFTASNGAPSNQTSLHHINQHDYNSYEKAIRSCGDIVAYYDYDQQFPVYGYGAIVKGNSKLSHCFPVNGNYENPNIYTIDSVLSSYRQCLLNVTLSGPTLFAPLINKFLNDVRSENNKLVYNILMILTDGMINDMDDTINAIVDASYLPVSIIIIGIGMNDFGNMDTLDADDNPLIDKYGRKAARDIVQFVPFYKFNNSGEALAKDVLEEVPRQLVDYYKIININPGNL